MIYSTDGRVDIGVVTRTVACDGASGWVSAVVGAKGGHSKHKKGPRRYKELRIQICLDSPHGTAMDSPFNPGIHNVFRAEWALKS